MSPNTENNFISICKDSDINISDNLIKFPERIVKLGFLTGKQLNNLISKCPYIAEIKLAPETNYYFNKLLHKEQVEWKDDLLSRTVYSDNNVTICLLDTGITSEHPLLKNSIQTNGLHTINDLWGLGDTGFYGSYHGTKMAGIALYNDLKKALLLQSQIFLKHKLESVKILPPKDDNEPKLYGAITKQAVAFAEIDNPKVNRSICLAVTEDSFATGIPSSWSSAIDSIISAAEDEGNKRLFFISAGNVSLNELKEKGYPTSNLEHSVESPGQAWNAITVGAYSKDIVIKDPMLKDYSPIAKVNELSPYSSTSVLWDSKWPIKPDIVFDGGNVATNGEDYTDSDELSLLTTNSKPTINLFSNIDGTSSATAQASWMASQIMALYPNAWPETIRALMIHSATWSKEMIKQFYTDKLKSVSVRRLLRTCGYGIPDLKKAIECKNNRVNLVIEGELRPFNGDSMNEMHFHNLPWSNEELCSLSTTQATLKVTLSYYVEPSPLTAEYKSKYSYQSCGLQFDVINNDETIEDFKKRINHKERLDDKHDKGDGTSGSGRWFIGSINRNSGSIHSDFIMTTAAALSNINYIAVYPQIGWWRKRGYLGKNDKTIRYSLVVSIETPETKVDFYNSIITQIQPKIEIKTSLSV